MQSIVVYCASSPGSNPLYQEIATELGVKMALRNLRLIYGGGNGGLMGTVANAVLENGGQVTGVIPNFLADLEVAHRTLTELHFVETMHERKFKMVSLAKGVITLPGGYGTFDELFEILAWRQLKLYDGPIAVLNVNGYYDLLLQQLDRCVADGFLRAENRNLLIVADTVDAVLTEIEAYWEQPANQPYHQNTSTTHGL
ncbi:MAG: TIGR00730 family Rossman fold protein [Bacteroidetes bacterium]|nr:TIGR00730 family Rossman fold protein [Fibrella sp.]